MTDASGSPDIRLSAEVEETAPQPACGIRSVRQFLRRHIGLERELALFRKYTKLGMYFTQVITTAVAQVGRAPWPARNALVPLLEAGRGPQCASHTKHCQTVPA